MLLALKSQILIAPAGNWRTISVYMFPKEIAQLLHAQGLGWTPGSCLSTCALGSRRTDLSVENWLLENESKYAEITAYFDYLRSCRNRFQTILKTMGYWNKDASHSLGHDRWSVGWGGDNLLPIASHLYALKSYGLSGNILECGAFKGSSTACLSVACKLIGAQLFCADSFEGLPYGEAHYDKGDFLGSLDEVKGNVERFGEIDTTTFIQGWYKDTLQTFEEPISLIWIDVDLYQSTLDVLNNVYDQMEDGGVVFSDGFSVGVDYEGLRIKQIGHENAGLCEPAGLYDFFKNRDLDYQAIPSGPPGLALIIPEVDESEQIIHTAENFAYLIEGLASEDA